MRWTSPSVDPSRTRALAAALGSRGLSVAPAGASVLAELLIHRGIGDPESASRFLTPELSHLHDPATMRGMKQAVERLEAAVERKERVLIYGDYDVDGTTAIVILKTAIELCGGSVDFHVPHRIREGYGMRDEVVERAASDGVRLIISVDTGIRAFAAAEAARRSGVDLIVTDHHLPGNEGLPPAIAVLNPNQEGCTYPCKFLCGAGVAFKLAQALLQRRLDRPDQSRLLMSFMKVVAIATIADSVPLLDENRVFARLGLTGLRSPVNIGLKALLDVAKLGDGRSLNASDVGFRVAPRLNAAGRMDVARDVVELFHTRDLEQARQIAGRLDRLNAERQDEERRILDEVERRLADDPALREAYCIVVDGDGWHRGVIGIVATRVVERYRRPALVLAKEGDEAHGSGRSIANFHLLNALESCRELFSRYGGHAHAAGFALPSANVPSLRNHLDAYARSCLTAADFEPQLEIDLSLPLEEVTPELFDALRLLEPFGMENREPVFSTRAVRLLAPPQAIKDKHVRLRVGPAQLEESATVHPAADAVTAEPPAPSQALPAWRRNVSFNAMGWRLKESCDQMQLLPGDRLDIAYTLGTNDHPEFGGLELTLRDLMRSK